MFDHPAIFLGALALFWLAALAIAALHGDPRTAPRDRPRAVGHHHPRYRYFR